MKHYKLLLFFLVLLSAFPRTIRAQVHNAADSTDDDTTVVDPDYKPLTRSGNTVNGKWYGIGNVVTAGYSNSYLCELLLKEDKKGRVTGYFNYFFRDGYFSNKLFGTYDRSAQTFKFKPVIVLFHQTVKADIGVDVPMYGDFILNLNSKDTTLTGFMMPVSNYKYLVPALNIKLGIVGKSEPTLKERVRRRKLELEEDPEVATVLNEAKKDAVNNASGTKNDVAKKQESKRNNYKNDVVKSNDAANRSYKNDGTTQANKGGDLLTFKDGLAKMYRADTIHPVVRTATKGHDIVKMPNTTNAHLRDTVGFKDQVAAVNQAAEDAYKRRTTNLVNTLIVKDDSVTVTLYDNGEFDHDSVSVFFNGKLIASNIELKTNAPAKFVVYLDTAPGAKNELTLFAQNLGKIPPNSALMIVEDTHDSRYEVTLKSDLDHNASVLLTQKP